MLLNRIKIHSEVWCSLQHLSGSEGNTAAMDFWLSETLIFCAKGQPIGSGVEERSRVERSGGKEEMGGKGRREERRQDKTMAHAS